MRSQSASALSAEERLRVRIKRYNEGSPKLLGEPLFFSRFRQMRNLSFFSRFLFLDSSSLVNAVFGVVDFLEFLLGCTAHIFA